MVSLLKKIFPFALLLLVACNLTKDVDVVLPEYDRQPVVECYLEPGKPFRMLLSESYSFFDPFNLDSNFLQNTLLDSAVVTISYDGKTETLANQLSFEFSPLKIFNYTGTAVVPATTGMEYTLHIILPNGKEINAQAVMLPKTMIDSVKVEFSADADTLARVLTYINDDTTQDNYYRRMLNYSSLDSTAAQDFIVNDRISQTSLIAFGTGYDLKEGDTIINTIFHISKPYYDYIESVQLAVAGNANPFAQPSPIKSNVSGSGNPVGVFTCLVYDRDTTVVHK